MDAEIFHGKDDKKNIESDLLYFTHKHTHTHTNIYTHIYIYIYIYIYI